jgi:hypothetical protein
MVDSTGSEPWLRLVAEPDDQTPWLSFAILAWLLAAAAALRPARVWWARRRPKDGALRGILVSTRWRDRADNTQISAADGSGIRLSVLRSPVPARLIAEPDKAWSPPELGLVTGQLWYGGVVQLRALDGEALADAVLGLPQLTVLRSWHAPPATSTVEDKNLVFDGDDERADSSAPMVVDGDGRLRAPALRPFTAYASSRTVRWILGSVTALLAAGTVAGAVASELSDDPGLWGGYVQCLFLLALAPLALHYVRARVAVNADGVTVVSSLSRYRIPWGAIDGVDLRLARGWWQEWGSSSPDEDFQLVFTTPERVIKAEAPLGPDSSTGVMVALMKRILAHRDQPRDSDAHPGTALKVTGAAAHRRRGRPPVSEPLPPADTPG